MLTSMGGREHALRVIAILLEILHQFRYDEEVSRGYGVYNLRESFQQALKVRVVCKIVSPKTRRDMPGIRDGSCIVSAIRILSVANSY